MEITHNPLVNHKVENPRLGLIHLVFSVGSVGTVDLLTERIKTDGFAHINCSRWTGDMYYESVVLDPDGYRVKITL